MKQITFFLIFLSAFLEASSQLKIARPFGEHMVLQRNKPIQVWGWASGKETVTIQLNGIVQNTSTLINGKWFLQLPAMKAGGPYEMVISGKKETIRISDIMIGEVWLCSGQSNMEFNLRDAFNYKTTQLSASKTSIRQFLVPNQVSLQPMDSITGGDWVIADPETLGNFTAVGYFFAKEIAQQLNVTVGLIKDSWGGSQIEGWIAKDAMMQSKELKDYGLHYPNNWMEADSLLFLKLKKDLSAKTHSLPEYDIKKILIADTSVFEGWLPYAPPSQWDWQGIWAFRGAGLMERTISIDSLDCNKLSTLSLGDNDSKFQLYINGRIIMEGEGKNSRNFLLPENTWKPGRNVVLIHQEKQVDPSWFGNGFIGEPAKLFLKLGSELISLSGVGWKMMPDFKMPWYYVHSQNNAGAIIYNAMIHPIISYTIKGVLWYQGESNAGRAYQYRSSFPLMIESWRKDWKDSLPFYFVQLSSFGKFPNSNQGSTWAELREAQTIALSLPLTGMAVTTDIGNPDNVHPRDKENVGLRLAANALVNTYHIGNAVYCGPVYESVDFSNNKAILSFRYGGAGLMVKDKYGYLKGFEIAGSDKKFYFAKASIEGNKILVWNEDVTNPIAIRYGWTDSPIDANLFNKEGFPAAPFRTDNWKGITEAIKFE